MMTMNGCKGQTPEKTRMDELCSSVVRPATQANRFYTGDARELTEEVDSFLALHSDDKKYNNVAAVIVPHAGYYFSGNVAAAAYMAIDPKKQYKRIFLLGPSHHEWLDGASVNTEADWYATPLGSVKVDHETAKALTTTDCTDDTDLKETTNYTNDANLDSVFCFRPEAHDREHCLEVQLPFLQRLFAQYAQEVPPIVPIVISTNDYNKLKRIAEVLKPYFTDENLFVISSDFSHYPSYEDACKVDAMTGKAIETGDVKEFIATINANARSGKRNLATSACGEFAIITLMLMLDKQYEVKHLMYQNSGDIDNHDHSRVVGYHSFAILRNRNNGSGQTRTDTDFSLSAEDKKMLKDIAFNSIRDSLDGKPIAQPIVNCQFSIINSKCGAFVSLHKHGRLRGCIGHFGEDYPLYEIVAEMARAAAFDDPRFMPVTRDELDDLDIEISVLTPMRRIQSLDEFELHRHGIYIKKGYRSGTFLPQVADEVNWTKEEFVGHCSQDKAGLGWDGWRDAELYVYEAIVF
jgi:AmmeMemoRadiSam system protein B/AmmeMemoRadiSam system protein A